MNFKLLKSIISLFLRGSIAKRVLLRAFLITFAIAIFPSLQVIRNSELANSDGCGVDNLLSFPGRFLKPVSAHVFPMPDYACHEMGNTTRNVITMLMNEKLLKASAKSLCLGDVTTSAVSALGELGFRDTFGMNRHPMFSFQRRRLVYELEYDDDSFDFVFSSDMARVSVPALVVLDIERVLKPGGIGVMLVYTPPSNPGTLIKSAAEISLYLKCSEVISASSVHRLFSLVIFGKKLDIVNPFGHYQLPDECPSITKNKPLLKYLEPLVEENLVDVEGGVSYLSSLANVSSTKNIIYIDIGAGQFLNSNTTNWFSTYYPVPTRAANVYVVDHNITVLSSYVNKPGITFVYHPGLAENEVSGNDNPFVDNEGFDFLVWFRETVAAEDFVVLKMNAVGMELQLLHQLFESGGICLVDELFLRCPGTLDGEGNVPADCMDLFKGLRSSGVFVHQWLDDRYSLGGSEDLPV